MAGNVTLNKANIEMEIKKIVQQRRDEIKKFLLQNEFDKALNGSIAKSETYKFGFGILFFIVLVIIFGIFGTLLISVRRLPWWRAFVEMAALGSYIGSTYSIHRTIFGGAIKAVTILIALVPVFFARGLVVFYPTISKPLENTIGYFWLSTFQSKDFEVMNNFDSRIFPSEMLKEFNSETSFNWLLTTFDVENVKQSINQLKGEPTTAPGSIVTDFYIKQEADVESKLKNLVEMKRVIGQFFIVFIASAIGCAGSVAQAVISSER